MKTTTCFISLAALLLCMAAGSADLAEDAAAQAETEAQSRAGRAQRAELRAFYTAPPVIPHDRELLRNRDCMICHAEIRDLDTSERTSLKSPHARFSNCAQCHVSIEPAFGEAAEEVESTWQGLEEPGEGTRAHALAPPTLPHRVFMRENCLSCHSTDNPYEFLRRPHPERVNCLQCHVADGEIEFKVSKTQGDGPSAAEADGE